MTPMMPQRSYLITADAIEEMKRKRQSRALWIERRQATARKASEILQLHGDGLGCIAIARRLDLHESSVWRFLSRAGVSMLPRNGSHRRVDTCSCGQPALERGSKCVDCERVRKRVSSRNSYRRRKAVPEERFRV